MWQNGGTVLAEWWREIGRGMTMTWQNVCVIILMWKNWDFGRSPSILVYTTSDDRNICPSCVLSCIPSAVITHYIGQKSSIIAFDLEILFSNGILSIILCFFGLCCDLYQTLRFLVKKMPLSALRLSAHDHSPKNLSILLWFFVIQNIKKPP